MQKASKTSQSKHRLIVVVALTALLGCAEPPVLNGRLSDADRAAPFPQLLPRDALTNLAAPRSSPANFETQNLQTRIANLRARVAQLSGPVIPRQTRSRMQGAIARAALR